MSQGGPSPRPPTNRAVVARLRKGQTAHEIGAALGVHHHVIEYHIAKHGLVPEAYGLIRLRLLAIELGVSRQALSYRARAGDFELSSWGRCPCVTAAEARKVRALFAHPKRADYAGWLSSLDAAQALGTTQSQLHRLTTQHPEKLAGVRFVRAQGVSGFAYLFCPADLPALNRCAGRRGLPKRYSGHHTATQLADLIGVTENRLFRWVRAGAPYREDWHGRYWFELHAVRVWLASGVICPRDLNDVLARMDAAAPRRAA